MNVINFEERHAARLARRAATYGMDVIREPGGTWALCAARGNPDTRIPLLADWLRRDLLSAD